MLESSTCPEIYLTIEEDTFENQSRNLNLYHMVQGHPGMDSCRLRTEALILSLPPPPPLLFVKVLSAGSTTLLKLGGMGTSTVQMRSLKCPKIGLANFSTP